MKGGGVYTQIQFAMCAYNKSFHERRVSSVKPNETKGLAPVRLAIAKRVR